MARVSKDGSNVGTRGHPSRRHAARGPQDEVGDSFAARLARKRNLDIRTATKQPAGQIAKILSSPRAKNIPLNLLRKSAL
jgi:hypothetical protein